MIDDSVGNVINGNFTPDSQGTIRSSFTKGEVTLDPSTLFSPTDKNLIFNTKIHNMPMSAFI